MKRSKRLFDLSFSYMGILVLFPILLFISILILCEDGRPVFFVQERVGYKGKKFKLYKFRTMRKGSEGDGRLITVDGDHRITRIGNWLRKLKLDELPQLFNVLRGEMSFVGPRPEVGKFVSYYTEEQRKVLNFVPGITDPASIVYRRESAILSQFEDPEKAYIDHIMPAKININLKYAQEASILRDINIIGITIKTLLFDLIKG